MEASTLSHIKGYPGAESKFRRRPNVPRSIREATTVQHRLEGLVPTADPTFSSIEELLQFAFAEALADEVAIVEPEVSEAEMLAAMDEAQDRVRAHLDERTKEHRTSRRHVRE